MDLRIEREYIVQTLNVMNRYCDRLNFTAHEYILVVIC